MNHLGTAFNQLIVTAFIAGIVVIGIIWGAFELSNAREIKSHKKLSPIRYELTVKNNKVDTIWVYKKP